MPPRPPGERIPNLYLRSSRLNRGWSQEDLANELIRLGNEIGERNLGVSAKTVGAWERGESVPRSPYPKLLVRLFSMPARALGMCLADTLEGDCATGDGEDMERRAFLIGSAFLPRALAGLSLEDFLHEPRRYLTAWATTPTRELVPPALGCMWLAEASGSDQAAGEAALLLAWLAYDQGHDGRMRQHYREAAEYARRSGSGRLLVYTLTQWAHDTEDGPAAVRLVEQARGALPKDAPLCLRGVLYANESVAYARLGERSRALDALARIEPADAQWPDLFPLDEGQIVRCHGDVAVQLGDPDTAIPALHRTLESYGPAATKRKARILAPLVTAYRQSDDPERADALRAEMRDIGHRFGLRRPAATV